jgi:hypothetical protein
VCWVIDELLNLELYKREFQFLQPKFPPDDENLDEFDEENADNLEGSDSVFLINGGVIEAREIKESPSGKNSKVTRK